jgi:ABC-type bacteriocin/lantibiotic exporter with double-glycine peptidase domain
MVAQREGRDCTAACLAMVVGVEYEVALGALRQVGGRTLDKSYRLCYVERAAALLGRPLRRRRRGQYDPKFTAGVICIRGWKKAHAAVLWHGIVFDTDGRVWLVKDYLARWAPSGRFCTLLEVQNGQ